MSISIKEIKDKIKQKKDKLLKKDKWKLYLYYKNQCIKRLFVDDTEQVFSTAYKVNIYFKKHLFGSNFIKTMFIAYKIKFIDKAKKEIYIEVSDYIGGEIE